METKKITIGKCTVNHWQNPRLYAFTVKKVALQVSAGFCECGVCGSRYGNFKYILKNKPDIKHIFEDYKTYYDTIGCGRVTLRSRWVILNLPKGCDALQFLREALGIQIDNVCLCQTDYLPHSLKE